MEFCASNKGKTKQKKKLNKIHSFGRTTGKKTFFFHSNKKSCICWRLDELNQKEAEIKIEQTKVTTQCKHFIEQKRKHFSIL